MVFLDTVLVYKGIEGVLEYTGCIRYTGYTGYTRYTVCTRVYRVYKGIQGVQKDNYVIVIIYLGTMHGCFHEILTRHCVEQNHKLP